MRTRLNEWYHSMLPNQIDALCKHWRRIYFEESSSSSAFLSWIRIRLVLSVLLLILLALLLLYPLPSQILPRLLCQILLSPRLHLSLLLPLLILLSLKFLLFLKFLLSLMIPLAFLRLFNPLLVSLPPLFSVLLSLKSTVLLHKSLLLSWQDLWISQLVLNIPILAPFSVLARRDIPLMR